ncbi:MAG: DUF4268 domain-containing protein [Flavobacteriaceae bacterium]
MYSKEEVQALKKEFWTTFAETYPRKWLLYDTKIKDFSFKFYIDNKKAEVLLAVEHKDPELQKKYVEKLESLQTLLLEDYLPEAVFDKNHRLENGKVIAKIWVEKPLGFHNKNNWQDIFDFFNEKMDAFERFFYEFEDFIR